ncbi:Polyubiqutin 4 [Glomus cerebriforme]|uniref:Polyubiqutin 4 n=1 Tax=Glomus cerebriforme TaxID=658196 RepID=A0A397S9M1_9GLOM|nr:Polyubiqutin 4 [Glomus cerebriforme]
MRISLEICSDDTISQVKKKIEKLLQVKPDNQELFLGSKQLKDNLKVSDYKIGSDEKLRLVRKAEGGIQVFIQDTVPTATKNSTAILINPSSTVLDLKKKYNERKGFPIGHQRLIFKGKQLEDDKKLSDYKIKHESSIHLVARLPGGF